MRPDSSANNNKIIKTGNSHSFNNLNKIMNRPDSSTQVFIGKYSFFPELILGTGLSATVYRGIDNSTKKPVAVKLIDVSASDQASHLLLKNECKVLRLLQHRNIVKLVEIISQDNKFFIITELYEGITLKDYIQTTPMTLDLVLTIFAKILGAVTYLIEKNILHRDIKPANIILTRDNEPILIDFGFSEIIHEQKISRVFNVGSPAYMSPEAYLKTLYSEKSESWALATLLVEMIRKKTLDDGFKLKEFYEKVRTDENFVKNLLQPCIALELRPIIEKALLYDSFQRLSVSGMKYLVDVLVLKMKREANISLPCQKSTSVAKIMTSKELIRFCHTPSSSPSKPMPMFKFQPTSPELKVNKFDDYQRNVVTRDSMAIKFVHPPPIAQKVSKINSKNTDILNKYINEKIRKGVFDTSSRQSTTDYRFSHEAMSSKKDSLPEPRLEKHISLGVRVRFL